MFRIFISNSKIHFIRLWYEKSYSFTLISYYVFFRFSLSLGCWLLLLSKSYHDGSTLRTFFPFLYHNPNSIPNVSSSYKYCCLTYYSTTMLHGHKILREFHSPPLPHHFLLSHLLRNLLNSLAVTFKKRE